MIPAEQHQITTRALARELKVHRTTVSVWARSKLKRAVFGRGRFNVQTLRDMGVLAAIPSTDPLESIPCPS